MATMTMVLLPLLYQNFCYCQLNLKIGGSENEISYNSAYNCSAPSYDYGYDGGVIEFYGTVNNNCMLPLYFLVHSGDIHHNIGEYCNGFLEIGGSSSDVCINNTFEFNIGVMNGDIACIHNSGKFGLGEIAVTFHCHSCFF